MDDSLNEIIPEDPNQAYDMYKVIGAVTDNGEFFEVQPKFAKNIITGFARFNGREIMRYRTLTASAYAGVLDVNASNNETLRTFLRCFQYPIISLVTAAGSCCQVQVRVQCCHLRGCTVALRFAAKATVPGNSSHCMETMVVATS